MHRENIDKDLGTALITPNVPVEVGTKGTWRLEYKAGVTKVETGGKIRFTIPHGFTAPQSKAFYDPGFVTVETEVSDLELSIEIISDIFCRLDPSTGHSGAWGRSVFVTVENGQMEKGDSLSLVYGNAEYYGGEAFSHAGAVCRELSGPAHFIVAVDPDGKRNAPFSGYSRLVSWPILNLKPSTISKIEVLLPTDCIEGDVPDAQIILLDQFNNVVRVQREKLELRGEGIVKRGIYNMEDGISLPTNPIRLNKENRATSIFWGDIHGHTIHSDGVGTPEEYFEYARDVSKLDFTAITDHDDIGPRLMDEEWDLIRSVAEDYYKPGQLVTFIGHEYRNGNCDMNLYYPGTKGSLLRGTDDDLDDASVLTKKVKDLEGMIIPHMHFGADWSGFDPNVYRLIEVYSQHGCAEYRGCPREIPYLRKQLQKSSKTNQDCYIHDALKLGFRLGFTAGSDTHSARPGLSDWTRTSRTYLGGLTAVLATELTREGIWDALKQRRCYATTGNRSILEFSVNQVNMGGEGTIKKGKSREIRVKCHADGVIQKITVWRSGTAWIEEYVKGTTLEKVFMDDDSGESDWYYVRLDLEGGEMVWGSPVWIDVL